MARDFSQFGFHCGVVFLVPGLRPRPCIRDESVGDRAFVCVCACVYTNVCKCNWLCVEVGGWGILILSFIFTLCEALCSNWMVWKVPYKQFELNCMYKICKNNFSNICYTVSNHSFFLIFTKATTQNVTSTFFFCLFVTVKCSSLSMIMRMCMKCASKLFFLT